MQQVGFGRGSASPASPAVLCQVLYSKLRGKEQHGHLVISRVGGVVLLSVWGSVPLQARWGVCARGRGGMDGAGPHALRRRLRVENAAAGAPELAPPRTLFLPLFCEVAGRALLFLGRSGGFSDRLILLRCVGCDNRSRVFFVLYTWCCLMHSSTTKKF
jgi:hypothetical protein